MLAAIRTGLGKTAGSRIVALGTRAATDEHWFSKMLDGGARYIQEHRARPDDNPFRQSTWKRANPSLEYFPALKARIAEEAKDAKANPSLLASFEALRLNKGTSDVLQSTLLDSGLWRSIEGDAAKEGPCFWGVDLGGSAASSAVVGFWPETGRLQAVSAFPAEPSFDARGALDGVSNLYSESQRRGELFALGGRSVDYSALAKVALERLGQPAAVASDR